MDFRFVVPVGPFRVGVLTRIGAVIVGEAAPQEAKLLNLPRPVSGVEGWHAVAPPAAPHVNPALRVDDIERKSGPDEMVAAAQVGPHALLSVVPPPDLIARPYLLRLTPRSFSLLALWIPLAFDGYATAFYPKGEKLGVIDLGGNAREIDYP